MVFRQVGNDTDKLISRFGLLNKSFKNIGKDLKNGIGVRSFTNIISKTDIENFNKFNNALNSGVGYSQAFKDHLSKSSTAIQEQAVKIQKLRIQQNILNTQRQTGKLTEEQYKDAIKTNNAQIQAITTQTGKLTLAQKASAVASKAAGTAMNVAFNMGIMLVINAIITGITYFVNREKELIEKANESSTSLKEQNQSIAEYKDKITELKDTLADETASEEDAYNARKQLVEIQDEIVSKYGLQKDSIDLVNDSLREEIALLDEVSRKEAESFIRENKKAINSAKKKIESEKSFSQNFSRYSFDGLNDLSNQLYNNRLVSIRSQHDGVTSFDSNFKGTTDEAIEHYTKLYDYIEKYRQDNVGTLSETENGLENIDKILASVSQKINDIKNEDYQNAKQLYDSATQSEIQSNDNYRNIYKATIDARQAYQEAIAQGNENAVYKSLSDMEKAKADFQESLNNGKIADLGVSQWFTDFYNDFETESGKYQFTVDIKANSDGLKDSVQEALAYFGDKTPTELDILNLEFSGSEKAQSAFQSLTTVAEQYGLSIEDLIAVLEQLEIVQIDAQDVDVTGQIVSEVKSNLAKIQAEIEDIFKNSNIFDKAIESINNGESVDFDTTMSMVEVDSSLADKFTKTADGYTVAVGTLTNARQKYIKSTQEQLQADITLSKQQAVIAEQNIKDLQTKRDALFNHGINSKSDANLLAEYDKAIESETQHLQDLNDVASKSSLYLRELASSALSTVSCFEKSKNAISGMEEKTTLLKKAMTEMRDAGSISADTYAELASKGADYVNCLEIQNGKLVLNTNKLKDLDTAALKAAITTNELAMAQINASMAGREWSEALKAEYNNIELATAALRGKLNEYNNTKPDKDKTPESITNFEKELARRQHEIKMGRMKEDDSYFDWLEKAYREAYKGLTGYQDDIYKYEEMVYDGRKKLAEDFYNEQKKYHDNRVEELESQITVAEDKSIDSDGNSLNPAEKFDYIRASYSDIIAELERRINEIVSSGIEGHEDEVKELEKQIEEYSDKLQNVFKDEIDYEIDYIKALQDKYNDFIDKRIDRYKEEKEAIEDKYDAEIKSIDDTIDALKDKNDAAKKAIELKKAEQDLENAKQRTRKVYGSDGTVTYRQDTEKAAEAQQKVDDIKLDMLIDSLEKQKKAVEGEKETLLNKYDDMIDILNEQKDKQSEYYDSLLEILNSYLNPNATENLDTVFERILADKNKIKIENGTAVVNGNIIDTSSIDSSKLNGDKINNNFEQMGKWLRAIGIGEESIEKLTKNPLALIGVPNMQHNSTMLNNEKWDTSRDNYTINNRNTSQPVNVTFSGGINIQNPVGEVHQFAKELLLQLPTAFKRQMYTNLK